MGAADGAQVCDIIVLTAAPTADLVWALLSKKSRFFSPSIKKLAKMLFLPFGETVTTQCDCTNSNKSNIVQLWKGNSFQLGQHSAPFHIIIKEHQQAGKKPPTKGLCCWRLQTES